MVDNEWDQAADTFDNEPDHGLRDPLVRQAWTELLSMWQPRTKAIILDIGCGTGSLSVVLAGLGHEVIGIDLSPRMIALAREKATAAGHAIEFHVMDAAAPPLEPNFFDVIVCRHLLWTLHNPEMVLQRWVNLLKPKGRLVLIEGFWNTGVGLHAADLVAAFPPSLALVALQNLSEQQEYWGKHVTDERYMLIADRQT
jgi:2-polyprenyl-3-methyl-5-hydroxy-6-metoxy-1,4-benzoquinol methylase